MLTYSNRIKAEIALHEALARERSRIARLCAYWLGDAFSAEDAAQEVLIEAWTHIEQLRDPEAFGSWLTGIARNVCARHGRAKGRALARLVEPPVDGLAVEQFDEEELAVTLDREELATLLDRALALVTEEARAVLVLKYLEETPNVEIAARLGLGANAVAVRLHRGRLALRELLATGLAAESAALGLPATAAGQRRTSLWCPLCGRERLLGSLTAQEFWLRCPVCHGEPGLYHAQATKPEPFLGGLKTFKPALNRFTGWMEHYFREGLRAGVVTCTKCGRAMSIRQGFPAHAPASLQRERGMHVFCEHCGSGSYATIDDFALGLPEGRAFYRAHPRIHVLPHVEVEHEGSPALVVQYASRIDGARFTAVYHRETYELMAIPEGTR